MLSASSSCRLAAAVAIVLSGCGSEPSPPQVGAVDAGADAEAFACPPGERPVSGACVAAGVPADACGAGFETDGRGGCLAAMPGACEEGLLAVPGDAQCREIAPCGDAPWGSIPVEPTTQYVDAVYMAGASDGTAAKPWTTIQAAIDAAEPAAVVAVASGSYAEDLDVSGKSVRLWGRCPSLVEIVGTGAELAAVFIAGGASGSEIKDLAVSGSGVGVLVSGSENVVVDRVWIHDTASRGVNIQSDLGATGVSISGSLIERAAEIGVYLSGATATIDASVVRATRVAAGQQHGRGVVVQTDGEDRGYLTLRGSVVADNREIGVAVTGADATVEASVVRGTLPSAPGGLFGRGFGIEEDGAVRATVSIRASLVEHNTEDGIYLSGSDATIENTTIRDTQPRAADGLSGRGVEALGSSTAGRAKLTLFASVLADNHDDGMFAEGSDVTLTGVLVRDTLPQPATSKHGGGIVIQDSAATGERGKLGLFASAVERCNDVSVLVTGSDAVIEDTAVRDTLPDASDQHSGRGVVVQIDPETSAPSSTELRRCSVERSHDFGVLVLGSTASLDRVTVSHTYARLSDGQFGDGIAVDVTVPSPGQLHVVGSRVEHSARAGIAAFGATAGVSGTVLECNAIHLDGEADLGQTFTFDDAGGNSCGCAGAEVACQVLTSDLAPPAPVQAAP